MHHLQFPNRSSKAMKGSRHDYFYAQRPLLIQLAGLLALGALIVWLMSQALPMGLWAVCGVALLACGGGIFWVSGRLLTRHHPVISVFNDRVWTRGLREQVVMLRNVSEVRRTQRQRAGIRYECIELDLRDDEETVVIPLFSVECAPDELRQLVEARVAALRQEAGAD
jgi:hypothetical protein